MRLGAATSLLRRRGEDGQNRVTFVELFFDLVFVFAVTQLSHTLLAHVTLLGAVQVALLFMIVWVVWIDTCWCTNWLDPRHTPVRLMLFAMMLGGLVMSISIPDAFAARGLGFGGAVAAMHVGRTLFMMWALRHHSHGNFLNFCRITAWRSASGALWLAGGFADGDVRFAAWAGALLIDYAAPAAGFVVPGLGRSTVADWDVEGDHMAERCGLFIIIALGESILVTGATFSGGAMTLARVAAFGAVFVGSVAMWWIYFNIGAEKGRTAIAKADDPGRLARLAYTYIHLPIGAGVVVSAVADEIVLAHPAGHADFATAAVVIGGAVLYLLGNLLFKRTLYGRMPLSHLVGLGLFALISAAVPVLSPLALAAAASAVLVIVAAWETWSLSPRKA